MTDAMVELRDVVKEYPLGKLTVKAVRGVDLTITKGEFAAIAGPSGSGKTTILNMIGCVDVPTRGEVLVDGQSTAQLSDKQLTDLRLEKLGFIFQSFNLIGVLDVFQNVEFPLLLQKRLSKGERRERVEEIVELVGLTPQMKQRPNELSGGQRQRVAIARALVTRPRIVLADEPTANLDSVTGNQIIELMHEINTTEDTTFIFSTHDPKVMERAERIILLEDGLVKDDGTGTAPSAEDRERALDPDAARAADEAAADAAEPEPSADDASARDDDGSEDAEREDVA